MEKDTTYVLTNNVWQKSKWFHPMTYPYNLYASVFLTSDGLKFCKVEFSY